MLNLNLIFLPLEIFLNVEKNLLSSEQCYLTYVLPPPEGEQLSLINGAW